VAAAIALASVETLDEIVAHRAALVQRYYEHLEDLSEVQLLPRADNTATSWYIMPIRVSEERRDGLRARLAELNVDSTVHYPNLLEQPAFCDCRGQVPVTARESRRVVSLPLHRHLGLEEVGRICEAVRAYLR
jgi:dTDP-4-amino-4,6-dideoxygalactose transaminase